MPATLYNSYAGGMNALANPRLMADDQVKLLVNGTVRSGWAEPRPAFEVQDLQWLDERAQYLWEQGVCQGSGVFSTPDGDFLFLAFDGHLLRLRLDTMECGQAFPLGADYHQPLFNPRVAFVHFQQRAGWMIAQDGTSRPVLLNGDTTIYKPVTPGHLRTGTLMADGWGRLAVVDHGRRRIRFSDHEFDPNSDALSFTEGNYFKNASYLEVPDSLGRIVAMQFGPSLNGNDDKGPLLVFCERGTRAYNVSLPRDQWITSDIAATILPTVGACAHRAVVARGNDVIFSDHEGRIQSLASAISRQQDARIERIDQVVWPLYRDEDATLRTHRCAVEFDGRVLVSVQPERLSLGDGRQRVRHQGMMVLLGDAAVPMPTVWDGLWTGVYPVAMHTARLDGRLGCLVLSCDSDGKHRLYGLTSRSGYDLAPEPKAVPMLVTLKTTDMEAPFRTKPWRGAAVRLGGMRGRVSLKGWWQGAETEAPWFHYHLTHEAGLDFQCGELRVSQPVAVRRINLPKPQPSDFYEATMTFEIAGIASLQEVALETSESPKPDPNTPLSSCSPLQVPAHYACAFNPFGYDLQQAPTI